MKELLAGIALFFSTPSGNTDVSTNLSAEKEQLETIAIEIKTYKRQIQLTEIKAGLDPAAKYLQIEKYTNKINELNQKAKEIKKVSELKKKWAAEDSLELLKKYPPIELKKDEESSVEKKEDYNMKISNI
jgi:superfamily II RNA helicase